MRVLSKLKDRKFKGGTVWYQSGHIFLRLFCARRMDKGQAPRLEGDALTAALKQQVQFYFSPQNLSTDKFLNSQMNSQKYVSIDVIASFPKMKNLTEDRNTLIQVIKQCQTLNLDETETMVRPNLKIERNTLILRDIPATIPVEEVSNIFQHPGCAAIVTIRPDINDTWFVTFDSEDKCQETALVLSGLQFQGHAIRFGMKSSTPSVTKEPVRPILEYPNANPYYSQQVYMGPGAYNPYSQIPYNSQFYTSGMGTSSIKGRGGRTMGRPPLDASAALSPGPENPPSGPTASPAALSVPAGNALVNPVTGSPKKTTRKESKPQVGKPTGTSSPRETVDRRGERGTKDPKKKTGRSQQQPDLGLDNFPALGTIEAPKVPAGVVHFDRELFAQVVHDLIRAGYARPSKMPDSLSNSDVIRDYPLKECQLLEPMPVMYPSSPSPLLAAQPHHSSEIIPFLDLNSYGNPYFPPDRPHEDELKANMEGPPQSQIPTQTPSQPIQNPPPKMSAAAIVAAAERESASRAEQEKKVARAPTVKSSPKDEKKDVKSEKSERGDRSDRGERGDKKKRDGGSRKEEGSRRDGGKGEGREGRDKDRDRQGKPRYAQKPGTEKKADTSNTQDSAPAGVAVTIPSPAGAFSYAEMARRAAEAKVKKAGKKEEVAKEEPVTETKKEAKPTDAPASASLAPSPTANSSDKKNEKMSWAAKMVASKN